VQTPCGVTHTFEGAAEKSDGGDEGPNGGEVTRLIVPVGESASPPPANPMASAKTTKPITAVFQKPL
jgi:hypothetical protein